MTEYVPPKVWTWDQPSGGQFANINRPIAGADARQGTCRSAGIRSSSTRWRRPTGRRSRSCSRSCSNAATRTRNMMPGRSASAKATSSERLRRHQPQQQDSGAGRPQRPEPVRIFEIRRDPRLPRREVRRVPARLRAGAGRDAVLAVLADGQRALPRRRLRPFLRLRAGEVRISDQPLFDGGQAPVRRPRPAARRERIYRRRRLHDRRHRDLALVRRRRARAGPTRAPTSSSRPHEYEHVMRWAKQIDARPAVKRGRIVNKLTGDPARAAPRASRRQRFRASHRRTSWHPWTRLEA